MIRFFDAFRRWCEENGIRSDDIEVTIAPLTLQSASRFETAWYRETRNLTMRPAAHQMPTSGHVYGIPFHYRRPGGFPFDDTRK